MFKVVMGKDRKFCTPDETITKNGNNVSLATRTVYIQRIYIYIYIYKTVALYSTSSLQEKHSIERNQSAREHELQIGYEIVLQDTSTECCTNLY